MVYTVDDMLRMLNQIKDQHGGAIPVVIPTSASRSAYENAAVEVISVSLHTDHEFGQMFVPDEHGMPAVAIV